MFPVIRPLTRSQNRTTETRHRKPTKDAESNVVSAAFNARNFRTGLTDPDLGGTWSFVPTEFDEIASQTDAKGVTTSFVYDKLGRMKTRTAPEGVATFTYDTALCAGAKSVGQLVKSENYDGTRTDICHDGYGRPKTVSRLYEGAWYLVDRTWDTYGRLDSLYYPSVGTSRLRVRHTYNANGYLALVREYANGAWGRTFWTSTSMDAFGNVTGETLGNGTVTTRLYDQARGHIDDIYGPERHRLGAAEPL